MLGEETVLLKALEGKRGQPEQRPPHPAERGLFDMPTVVHNVQTLAAVPWIVANGAAAFARSARRAARARSSSRSADPAARASPRCRWARRCARSSGSAGKLPRGRKLKALLVGGPSGGLLPPDLLDTPYDFEALRAAGAHLGSGSVVIADDRACLVDLAGLLTRFCASEACGKSIPCRIGTRRLAEIGDRIARAGLPPERPRLLGRPLAHDIVGVRPVRPRAPGDASR